MKLATILFICCATPAMASTPSLFALHNSYQLSDAELDSLKGKYTTSGQDYYFGLQMQTQYIQQNGTHAQVSMQIEFSQINQTPTVSINVSESGDVGTNSDFLLDDLGQAAGLQQRIQISGEDNLAVNELSMAPGRLVTLNDGMSIQVGTTLVSQNGAATFAANNNAVGYQINLVSGQASQGINYGQGNGQLIQSILIDGANHGVTNSSIIRYDGIPVGPLHTSVLGGQINDLRASGI